MKVLREITLYSIVIILILALLTFGGCSGGDSSNRFSELLKLIPSEATYNKAPMTLFDYISYREDNDISFFVSSNHTEVLIDYFNTSNRMKWESG